MRCSGPYDGNCVFYSHVNLVVIKTVFISCIISNIYIKQVSLTSLQRSSFVNFFIYRENQKASRYDRLKRNSFHSVISYVINNIHKFVTQACKLTIYKLSIYKFRSLCFISCMSMLQYLIYIIV